MPESKADSRAIFFRALPRRAAHIPESLWTELPVVVRARKTIVTIGPQFSTHTGEPSWVRLRHENREVPGHDDNAIG